MDMIWISKTSAINIHKMKTLSKTFSDQNSMPLTFKRKNGTFRWKLNERLQTKIIAEYGKKKLKGVFFLD